MCDERERLIGYVYDECDIDEKQRVDDHLESCTTCRAEISALRDVRQDLLAWRVPAHEPVWRPLAAPAPVAPWWRQVPAWALAAAASVMFLAGALGGAMIHAWLPQANEARTEVTPPRPVTPGHTGVTAAELSAAQQQLLQMMRAELGAVDRRVRLVSAQDRPAPRVTAAAGPPEEAAPTDLLRLIVNDIATVQNTNDKRYQDVRRQLEEIRAVLASSTGR